MPDFGAIADLLGAIDDLLGGAVGIVGSLTGDGIEDAFDAIDFES